jgi:hypothetical protein
VTSNITGGDVEKIFTARLLGKHEVQFFRCKETGFIQTEKPYWLEEAYKSPMNLCDTGVLTRNAYFSGVLRAFFGSFFTSGDRFLDYAGGYGVLMRMMRDMGFDYFWWDPYTQNVVARGFEGRGDWAPYAAVSAIEVFEHLSQPREDVRKILDFAPNVLMSTVLVPEPWPQPGAWWYYGLDHGQHVSFYTVAALDYISRTGATSTGFCRRSYCPWKLRGAGFVAGLEKKEGLTKRR